MTQDTTPTPARQEPLPHAGGEGNDGPVRVGAFGQLTPHGPAVLLVLGEHRLLLATEDVRLLALRLLDEVQVAEMMAAMERVGLADKTIGRAVKAAVREQEKRR